MVAQRKLLMSLTGLDDDEVKNKKGSKAKTSKASSNICCKFGSPKYWQMMLNDIPLLVCLPFAYQLGVADASVIYATTVVSGFDLLAMLVILSSVDQLSIDTSEVYETIDSRNKNKR